MPSLDGPSFLLGLLCAAVLAFGLHTGNTLERSVNDLLLRDDAAQHDAQPMVRERVLMRKLPIYCFVFAVVMVFVMMVLEARSQAQVECIPDLKTITDAIEDVQRIRVGTEEQSHLLRDIREALRSKK